MSVDISGIDKGNLLYMLWKSSNGPVNMGWLDPQARTGPSLSDCESAAQRSVDYFCGVPMKINLSGNTANGWLYNRENGAGKFEAVVKALRETTPLPACASEKEQGED